LDYGTFLGVKDGNLTKFLGVPFAQPTKRFELPLAPVPLHGLQNATAFGPACPQQALTPSLPFVTPNHTFISEACAYVLLHCSLNLDVFSPLVKPGAKLPVLVWLFGGGFEYGSSSDTDMRPTVERSIALGEPVTIVVPNYRLNAFGFLAGKEAAAAGITNLGLRDQIFALEWVQKHISAFGGDPGRAVLGGVSAGAISTSLFLLSNNRTAPNLFRGAFMVSGAPWPSPTVAAGQPFYDALVSANNCTDAPGGDTLRCLQDVPLDAFLATVDKTPDFLSYRSLSLVWRPRVDGDVVLRNPVTSVTQGAFAKIPFMSGDVDDEGTFFAFASTNVTTDTQFVDYIHSNYLKAGTPAQVSRIVELYPRDPTVGSPFNTGSANQLTPEFKRIAAFEGDFLFSGLRRLFLRHAAGTQRTWSWLSKRGKSTLDLGAFHTSDVALCAVNFINTLDPNTSGAPRSNTNNTANSTIFWPAYTPTNGSLLTFADPAPLVTLTPDTFRGEQMEFLDALHLSGVSVVGL
ncbi:carotenoid ester lipase precursor, partial [Mycena galericulata]